MNVADLIQPVAAPAAPVRRSWQRIAIASGIAAALGVATLFLPGMPFTGNKTVNARDEALQGARQTLASFLASERPEDRAAWVTNGNSLLPLMQAYYAGREAEELKAEAFQPVDWKFDGENTSVLALELQRERGLPPVIACFRSSENGQWLMDWDVWTQSSDGQLRDFIQHPAEGERTLRVRLTSSARMDDCMKVEVTDAFGGSGKISFDIQRPDLAALYSRDLPAGKTRTATVQLVWLNDGLTGTLQPTLRRHVCWGFDGLDGVVPPAPEIPSRAPQRPPRPTTEPAAADDGATAVVQSGLRPTGAGAFTVIASQPGQVKESVVQK